jgi:ApaG protein
MSKGTSDTVTHGIRIRVGAQFVSDQSDPDRRHYVFAYRVVISNEGTQAAQLLSRHWVIRDAHNDVREVRGPGVVGEQPRIEPGGTYEYMSGCPLPTEWGTMEGTYTMQRDDGSRFEAAIGRFFLAPNTEPLSALTRS